MPCNISGKILCMCSQCLSNYVFLLTNNIYVQLRRIYLLKMTLPNVWVPEHNMFCVYTLGGFENYETWFLFCICVCVCVLCFAQWVILSTMCFVCTHMGGALSRWDPPHTWYWPAGLLWKEANTFTATALIVIKTPSLWSSGKNVLVKWRLILKKV